jgi:DNA-directed RNA polymerase specialized sigma24 family protein
VLRHYYGYEYAEIAAFLGTKPGSVGSTLSRAHAQLRAALGQADRETARSSERSPTNPAHVTPPEALR